MIISFCPRYTFSRPARAAHSPPPTAPATAHRTIAGLGGALELLGTQLRLINGFGAGYGFDGVAMALIASLHPLAGILVAIFFAAGAVLTILSRKTVKENDSNEQAAPEMA